MRGHRRIALLLVALFAFGVLALPVTAAQPPARIITFWYALPARHAQALEALLPAWREKNSQWTLQTKRFETEEELLIALERGSQRPSVALIDPEWTDNLAQRHLLVPAEDLMMGMGSSVRVGFKLDIFSPMWAACQSGDGKLYTVPAFGSSHALLYNKTIFAAGKIAKAPASWGEVVTLSKKLTKADAGQWGFVLSHDDPEELGLLYQVFLWQAGGELYSNEQKSFRFREVAGVSTGQFLVDLVQKYRVTPSQTPSDLSTAAMTLGTYEDLLALEARGVPVGVAPLPKKINSVSDLDVWSVAVLPAERNTQEKSWQFAIWLTDFPQALSFGLSAPYLPANKQVTLSPDYFIYLQSHPGVRVFLAQLVRGRENPGVPHFNRILSAIGERLQAAMDAKMPVTDAIDEAAIAAGKILHEPEGVSLSPQK